MQKIISAISLLFAVSLLFCSCGSAGDNTCETKDPSINRTVYGSADREYAHEFIYEITGTDGEIQSFVIKTDEQTVCDALTKLGEKIDYAINVDVPDENIIKRMGGRRACLKCGATYHIEHVPPKKEGICDNCGEALVLRDDDKPETVQKRLSVYHEQTQPLIDYYEKEGVLKNVDGTKEMNAVFDDICGILG